MEFPAALSVTFTLFFFAEKLSVGGELGNCQLEVGGLRLPHFKSSVATSGCCSCCPCLSFHFCLGFVSVRYKLQR